MLCSQWEINRLWGTEDVQGSSPTGAHVSRIIRNNLPGKVTGEGISWSACLIFSFKAEILNVVSLERVSFAYDYTAVVIIGACSWP